MNKQTAYIHTVISVMMLLLLACGGQADKEAPAFATGTNNKKEPTEIAPLPENLSVKELNLAQRNAFEAKSIQKLQDFFDYIQIISDPEVNADLRSHSYNLALELFVSDTATVKDSLLNGGNPLLVKDYLSSIMIKKNKVIPVVKQVQITTPLGSDSTAFSQGQINAIFVMRKQKLNKTINIHLIEIEKEFGETNQKTIEVKLGNIY